MLGVIRAQQERFVEAAQLIGAVVLAAPRDAVAWANHGNVLGSLGRHTEALESYNRAVALHPQNAQTGTIAGMRCRRWDGWTRRWKATTGRCRRSRA